MGWDGDGDWDGVQDAESGWSSLHRALHFGHLAAAGVLLEGGASLAVEDTKGRTPVDLIAGPLAPLVGDEGTRSTRGPASYSRVQDHMGVAISALAQGLGTRIEE